MLLGLVGGVVGKPERRGDQRCVVLDVRAHDQHVARLERGVVGEQADEDLAQHLDLTLRAVAGVHLQGPVTGVELWFRMRNRLGVVLQ